MKLQRMSDRNWACVLAVVGILAIFVGLFVLFWAVAVFLAAFSLLEASAVEVAALAISLPLTGLIVTNYARDHSNHWVEALVNTKHTCKGSLENRQ